MQKSEVNITNNLEHDIMNDYLKLKKEIHKIFDSSKVSKIRYITEDIIEFYDNENMLLRASFQEIGTYDINTNIWVWSWDKVPTNIFLSKYSKFIKTQSKKFFDKIIETKNKEECKILEKYYYLSQNGYFYYTGDVLEIIKYSLFMTKSPWYFTVTNKLDNNVPINKNHYLFITNVINY